MPLMWLKAFPWPPPGLMYRARRESCSSWNQSHYLIFNKLKKKAHNRLFMEKIKYSSVQCQPRGGDGRTSWQQEREQEEQEGATVVNWMNLLWGWKPACLQAISTVLQNSRDKRGDGEGWLLVDVIWCIVKRWLLHNPVLKNAAERDHLSESGASALGWKWVCDLIYESREPAGEQTHKRIPDQQIKMKTLQLFVQL